MCVLLDVTEYVWLARIFVFVACGLPGLCACMWPAGAMCVWLAGAVWVRQAAVCFVAG